jgi:hypothetical protein
MRYAHIYEPTTDPNITAPGRRGVKVLFDPVRRGPVVKQLLPGVYYLTCMNKYDDLVIVPCNIDGVTIPPPRIEPPTGLPPDYGRPPTPTETDDNR